jgi:hypothetical protein
MINPVQLCESIILSTYQCGNCQITYKFQSGFWKHNRKCNTGSISGKILVDKGTFIRNLQSIMKMIMHRTHITQDTHYIGHTLHYTLCGYKWVNVL